MYLLRTCLRQLASKEIWILGGPTVWRPSMPFLAVMLCVSKNPAPTAKNVNVVLITPPIP